MGFLDYFPWIWDIAAVLESGFELLRFALVNTTLCCWWSSAPLRKEGWCQKLWREEIRRGDDTCLVDWLRALVVLSDELRVFLLVVNQVESRAAAIVVPVRRGR